MKPAARPAASEVALVLEDPAAFGEGGDHQAVPGDEDLGILGRRDSIVAHGQEPGAAGVELGAELIFVASEQLRRLPDRARQVQDVVSFPVAGRRDIVDISECFGALGAEDRSTSASDQT